MGVGMSPSRRPVGAMQRLVRQLYVVYDGAGDSITEGDTDVSIVKNGVGDYSLTLDEAYLRKHGCMVTVGEADRLAYIESVLEGSLDIKVTLADGATAADTTVYLLLSGFDAEDKI